MTGIFVIFCHLLSVPFSSPKYWSFDLFHWDVLGQPFSPTLLGTWVLWELFIKHSVLKAPERPSLLPRTCPSRYKHQTETAHNAPDEKKSRKNTKTNCMTHNSPPNPKSGGGTTPKKKKHQIFLPFYPFSANPHLGGAVEDGFKLPFLARRRPTRATRAALRLRTRRRHFRQHRLRGVRFAPGAGVLKVGKERAAKANCQGSRDLWIKASFFAI